MLKILDTGVRRYDRKLKFLTFCEFMKLDGFQKRGQGSD